MHSSVLHLSGRPTRVPSEDEVRVAVVAVGGTTAGVVEGELTGIQTGNRLRLHSPNPDGSIRKTLWEEESDENRYRVCGFEFWQQRNCIFSKTNQSVLRGICRIKRILQWSCWFLDSSASGPLCLWWTTTPQPEQLSDSTRTNNLRTTTVHRGL